MEDKVYLKKFVWHIQFYSSEIDKHYLEVAKTLRSYLEEEEEALKDRLLGQVSSLIKECEYVRLTID